MTIDKLNKLKAVVDELIAEAALTVKPENPSPNYEAWHIGVTGLKYRQCGDRVLVWDKYHADIGDSSHTVEGYRCRVDDSHYVPCDPPNLPDGEWTVCPLYRSLYRVRGKDVLFVCPGNEEKSSDTWDELNTRYLDGQLVRATWKPPTKSPHEPPTEPRWTTRENIVGYWLVKSSEGQRVAGADSFLSQSQAEAIAEALNKLEEGK